MYEFIILLGIGIWPFLLSMFIQKRIVNSTRYIFLKSIGNYLLMALLQTLFVVGFVFVIVKVDPTTSEGAGWLFVAYVIYSPFILLFNLIVQVSAHFTYKRSIKKNISM